MWSYYDRMHDGYDVGWFAMLLVMLLLVGLAVALLVVLLRSQGQAPGRAGTDQTTAVTVGSSEAVSIVRRRFAAGEIDEEEFRRRLAALSEPT